MDLEMPVMDGIEATAALRTVVPQSAVVILSIHIDKQTRVRAQAAGAVAFVEKRGTTDTLLAVIRQAAAQAGEGIEERENLFTPGGADETHTDDDASRP